MLNSNNFSGKLSYEVENLKALENLSLFENNFVGQVPFELENLSKLKEMNISYNKFNGLISYTLAKKDTFQMTMLNEKGLAVRLPLVTDNTGVVGTPD
jgi:hypothetical protein